MRESWSEAEAIEMYEDAADEAVFVAAEYLLETANQTAPIEEATLIRSGATGRGPGQLTGEATVYYDTPYARRQHEELDYRHDPGRRAKWLELTFIEQEGVAKRLMAEEVARRVS